jgi:hypothetical protein
MHIKKSRRRCCKLSKTEQIFKDKAISHINYIPNAIFCLAVDLFYFTSAVISSGALKNGYDLDMMHSKITPVAHMSTAVV